MNAPKQTRKYVHSGLYSKKNKLAKKELKSEYVMFPGLVIPNAPKKTTRQYIKSGKFSKKNKKPVIVVEEQSDVSESESGSDTDYSTDGDTNVPKIAINGKIIDLADEDRPRKKMRINEDAANQHGQQNGKQAQEDDSEEEQEGNGRRKFDHVFVEGYDSISIDGSVAIDGLEYHKLLCKAVRDRANWLWGQVGPKTQVPIGGEYEVILEKDIEQIKGQLTNHMSHANDDLMHMFFLDPSLGKFGKLNDNMGDKLKWPERGTSVAFELAYEAMQEVPHTWKNWRAILAVTRKCLKDLLDFVIFCRKHESHPDYWWSKGAFSKKDIITALDPWPKQQPARAEALPSPPLSPPESCERARLGDGSPNTQEDPDWVEFKSLSDKIGRASAKCFNNLRAARVHCQG